MAEEQPVGRATVAVERVVDGMVVAVKAVVEVQERVAAMEAARSEAVVGSVALAAARGGGEAPVAVVARAVDHSSAERGT